MRSQAYVIYDKEAEECGPIVLAKNDKVAIRKFHDSLKKLDNCTIDEFKLVRIGELDHDQIIFTVSEAIEVDVPQEE